MNHDLTGTGNMLRNADVGHMLELREKLAASEAKLSDAREALKFYARIADYKAPFSENKLYLDCGLKARQALDTTAP